jgi:hypothetical protein
MILPGVIVLRIIQVILSLNNFLQGVFSSSRYQVTDLRLPAGEYANMVPKIIIIVVKTRITKLVGLFMRLNQLFTQIL